jgi:hypothetical protein
MQVLYSFKYLLCVDLDEGLIHRIGLVDPLQRATGHILQEYAEFILVLMGTQVLDNILVVEATEQLNLTLHGLDLLLLVLLREGEVGDGHLLNRHDYPMIIVEALVDPSEGAVANLVTE